MGAGRAAFARHPAAARARAPSKGIEEHLRIGEEDVRVSPIRAGCRSEFGFLAFVEKAVPALAFRVFPSTTFLTTQSRMMAPRNIFSGLISVMLLSVARQ